MKQLMENWRRYLKENYEVPPVLYHASYGPLIPSIQKDGLGGDRETYWDDSVRGVVYLALDPEVAFSYAETSDDAWDKFEGDDGLEIIVMEIDTTQLNPELFKLDSNVVDNEGDTVEYHGVVQPAAIKVIDRRIA
tara:strand:+ start:382 stop:786 length:405 start_codon:yes stop_codon:yes gene_type:complete